MAKVSKFFAHGQKIMHEISFFIRKMIDNEPNICSIDWASNLAYSFFLLR